MSIGAGLFTYLKTVTAVTDLIGTGDNCRLFPEWTPEAEAYPYVTYTVIAADHVGDLSAASGIVRKLIQVDVWAATAVSREATGNALRGALDGVTNDTWGSVNVRTVALDEEVDELEEPADGDEGGVIFRRRQDYIVWHAESVPTFA